MINTATKVDPGAAGALQGFVPGLPIAAQHNNHVFNAYSCAIRRDLATKLCVLRARRPDGLTYISTDTNELCGVVSASSSGLILIAKGDRSVTIGDGDNVMSGAGAMAGTTSNVLAAARNGTRIVVVGTGGNRNAFTTDDGETWTEGGALTLGHTANAIIWNNAHGRFITSRLTGQAGALSIHHSTNGVAWAEVATRVGWS